MTQTPEEWTIAALADRKSGIEIGPLRPAALKPYQEAMLDWLQDSTSTKQVTVMATRVGTDPRRTLRAHEMMAKLAVDRLKEMAAQIDTAAAAEAELDKRAEAFGEWAKDIPFVKEFDPEAKCRRVIGPDGLWMLEVGGDGK